MTMVITVNRRDTQTPILLNTQYGPATETKLNASADEMDYIWKGVTKETAALAMEFCWQRSNVAKVSYER